MIVPPNAVNMLLTMQAVKNVPMHVDNALKFVRLMFRQQYEKYEDGVGNAFLLINSILLPTPCKYS
jgi:hypothetical protein